MNNRFKNLQPPKNMFKRKTKVQTSALKTNSRWKNLDSNTEKKNAFKKPTELKQNGRWVH